MALPPLFDKLRLPAVGAPQFIIANPELVTEQCKAGIVGSFPALNARPQPLLDDWLHRIKDTLAEWDEAHPDTPAAAGAVRGDMAQKFVVHVSLPRDAGPGAGPRFPCGA